MVRVSISTRLGAGPRYGVKIGGKVVTVITGFHSIIYAEDADRARDFFRDVLQFPYVDAHEGWLIFQLPPGELGIHPAGDPGVPGRGAPSGHHELYLMCENVEETVAELTSRGVEFSTGIENQNFGMLVRLRVPGAGEIGLYQPRHPTAHDLGG
jgi:catechol 2,3-dioxygenase-like lactoylglutathione lyase family enzyme